MTTITRQDLRDVAEATGRKLAEAAEPSRRQESDQGDRQSGADRGDGGGDSRGHPARAEAPDEDHLTIASRTFHGGFRKRLLGCSCDGGRVLIRAEVALRSAVPREWSARLPDWQRPHWSTVDRALDGGKRPESLNGMLLQLRSTV